MNQTSHQGKAEKPGEILCLVPQVVARNLFPMGQAMEAQRKVFSCRILSRTVQRMQNQLFEQIATINLQKNKAASALERTVYKSRSLWCLCMSVC